MLRAHGLQRAQALKDQISYHAADGGRGLDGSNSTVWRVCCMVFLYILLSAAAAAAAD